jgi:hypothetical protein
MVVFDRTSASADLERRLPPPEENDMAKHPDRDATRNILAGCLEIYRRNANTSPEDACHFITGSVRLALAREDVPLWKELLTKAAEIPALSLVSQKQIERSVLEALSDIPITAKGVSKLVAEEFLDGFRRGGQEYVVERPVWGLVFDSASDPIELGPFRLLNRDTHQEAIPLSAFLKNAAASHERDAPRTWASTTVSAWDETKALEIADRMFGNLEDILNFLLPAYQRERQISIVTPNVNAVVPYRISCPPSCAIGAESHGLLMPVSADDVFFRQPSPVLLRLISLVPDKSANSPLGNALLYAVKWCAQSRVSQDPATAFVQATIALEAVLGHAAFGKGGISGRLATNAAHILGRTPDECLEIENLVAKGYRLRSEGVHGNPDISKECARRLSHWQSVVTEVIVATLTAKDFACLTTLEQVADILRMRPYAYKNAGG